jgi:hypothetical protein
MSSSVGTCMQTQGGRRQQPAGEGGVVKEGQEGALSGAVSRLEQLQRLHGTVVQHHVACQGRTGGRSVNQG